MVRTARFAFDDPRGSDQGPMHDPFEDDDPLFDPPVSDRRQSSNVDSPRRCHSQRSSETEPRPSSGRPHRTA